jgi:hypothetical protein
MRPGALLRTTNRNVRGGLATVVGVYVFDALIVSQGAITFIAGWVMALMGIIDIARGRLRKGVTTIVVYALLDVAVFGTIRLNNELAGPRAEAVLAALDHYKSDHGRYPDRLDALVPRYLAKVPLAKVAIGFNELHYFLSEDGTEARLWYVVLAPFGRRVYFTETRRWQYMD